MGCKVWDIYVQHSDSAERIIERCSNEYIRELANAVAGKLGGKVGVAPRIFLKKLVADVLDRIDQYEEFDPREHYQLTMHESELNVIERHAAGANDIDAIELEL